MSAVPEPLHAERPQLLQADGLVKRFGGVTALDGVSVNVGPHEVVGIIGPNGSGKTTLFNLLTGFLRPDRGTIRWSGIEVTTESAHRRARRGLVRTFQETMLLPGLTVEENADLAVGVVDRTDQDLSSGAALLEYVGLASAGATLGADLSWGEARLLGIGLTLALQPKVLLLDEPFAGLSTVPAETLSALILRLRDAGRSLCVVDHKVAHLMPVCDRVIVLVNGSIIANGPPAEIVESPEVRSAYLGMK
jgi:ABC-type branched-subunit amino acid transport system ATPase component